MKEYEHTFDDGPDPRAGRECDRCCEVITRQEDAYVDDWGLYCEACGEEIKAEEERKAREKMQGKRFLDGLRELREKYNPDLDENKDVKSYVIGACSTCLKERDVDVILQIVEEKYQGWEKIEVAA